MPVEIRRGRFRLSGSADSHPISMHALDSRMRRRLPITGVAWILVALLPLCAAAATAALSCSGAALSFQESGRDLRRQGPVGRDARGPCHLALRGGGNALGANGEAITEEQAGEELIKAATANNIAVCL